MTSTLLKYNIILIVLCIGMSLIHNSSGATDRLEFFKYNCRKDINLYFNPMNPPCRSVLLALEALNLEINLINIRLSANKKPIEHFLKTNYKYTIPVIQDGDFVLSGSHAIIVYLVRKYGGKDDHPLYPNDPKLQAQVNQRLHFDNGTLYPAFKIQYNKWIYYRIAKTKEREYKIHKTLEFLENVLKKSPWTAGDSMTVADFSLVASISTFQVAGVDLNKYDNINKWFIKCTNTMAGYENVNKNGITLFNTLLNYFSKKMTSTLLNFNVILIVLCIGMTLTHTSSGGKYQFLFIKKDINLYFDPMNPPCRSVLLALEALNLEINLINIRLSTNKKHIEHFLKTNYKYTIPVIQDGNFVLSGSHAIIVYLVRKYGGKDDHPLYPNDPKLQAQVNQRLHFDNGTLYPAFKIQYNMWIYHKILKTKEKEDKIHEALEFLENVLEKSYWAAGKLMTVADFSLVTSISTFKSVGVDLKKYDNINEWFRMCTNTMDGYEKVNKSALNFLISLINYQKEFDKLNRTQSL
ncbi:uncharacterized protein LOC132952467 [Metopolophium dirhodum]|uniref:uncharacterized protein LOC132952467 n=1 Tax=Metopolophium dirhodum TaxID=44670 RepID=UPI00298FB902|nr:uncharacterized protein LOC132952467 [Metopolophium dirhodum]